MMTSPDQIEFLDHRNIEWQCVKRMRYFCYQRFAYNYPGPVNNLHQNLVVVPADHYGDQQLCDYALTVSPHPAAHKLGVDQFGNRVFKLHVRWIARSIAFEVRTITERIAGAAGAPALTSDQARHFLAPTRLTASDDHITAVAHELRARTRSDADFAEQTSEWVSQAMRYGSGATGVNTTAAEALAGGKGLCQDYAHIMIAICRAAGLPARYVSGHMLGEGGSHAWVDVLLSTQDGSSYAPVGFDPTNRRQPNLGYTTVAIGRDYCDVSPSSGTYSAPYGGGLSFTKRAGLTFLEYVDGTSAQAAS